jgi:hypothetical protein
LEVGGGALAGDLVGDFGGVEAAGAGELAGEEGLDLGDDGEGDGGGAVAAEVEADGGPDAVTGGFEREAEGGGGLTKKERGAVAGAEEADVSGGWVGGEELKEGVAILLVAVGDEDGGVGGLEGDFGEGGSDVGGVGEAFCAGEGRASVEDDGGPAEEMGEGYKRSGVFACAEDEEALGWGDELEEGGVRWGGRFVLPLIAAR